MSAEQSQTRDGYICHADGKIQHGLATILSENRKSPVKVKDEYDVIIIGAGFAGLIAARELSLRDRQVLIVEAKDRIGGRTLTTKIDGKKFEIGGTWIHWTQPHVWTEMTRYGFSLVESEGAVTEQITLLLDRGTRVKTISADELYSKLFQIIDRFSDVDGLCGRRVLPFPHSPLTMKTMIEAYDQLSIQDRLDQISDCWTDDDDLRQFVDAYLSMNSQTDLSHSGFLDHLCFWALGDYETSRTWEKTSRYKIRQGTNALAEAILNDCRDVDLLLSTPISKIKRTEDHRVMIQTETGQILTGRTTIVTVPLNALRLIEFQPGLNEEKQRVINEGQCRGGTKFWIKLEQPIGQWCGFAAYPNPITVAYTDDAEGTIIVGFGPDDALDVDNLPMVERELQKFLPHCKVKSTFGHDWREDRFIQSTWSWYRPGQILTHLETLQKAEPPIFFASGDASNSWRGCIDGAIESGLNTVRHVQEYLFKSHLLSARKFY